jgi:hypothetical protein
LYYTALIFWSCTTISVFSILSIRIVVILFLRKQAWVFLYTVYSYTQYYKIYSFFTILLFLLYCNPSCCLLATLAITTLKLLPYRADSNISDLIDSSNTTSNKSITTAVELEQLQNKSKTFNLQELKELNTRVKVLEKIVYIEDCFRFLENRKYSRNSKTSDNLRSSRGPSCISVLPSVEADNLDFSSTNSTAYYWYKYLYYTKRIKVIPSYTFKISSSFKE